MDSKKLNKNLKIKNLLVPINKIPVLYENDILKDALEKMSKFKYGICFCIKKNGSLCGVLTDGDIRRKILNVQKPFSALLSDDLILHINGKPLKAKINDSIVKCLEIMEQKLIWDLPVVDKKNKLLGMLHLHPIVKKLVF
jgi:arabinose-5-phosphate isomerase